MSVDASAFSGPASAWFPDSGFAEELVVATLDLRRRWPLSSSSDLRPSIPSLVTAKKKFFGYMCLSIRCSLRF